MLERTRLEPLAAQHVKELRERFHIEPTLDDILWLHDLAKRVMRPGGAPHAGLAGAPVRVGNLTLWPMTIGAGEWFATVGLPLCEAKNAMGIYVTAYAMACARQPEVLLPIASWSQLRDCLKQFRRGMGVRAKELVAAVQCVLERDSIEMTGRGDDELEPERDDIGTYRKLIAKLLTCYPGSSPDYWRWGLARSDAIRMVAAWHEQQTRPGQPQGEDPYFKAFIAARAKIIEEHRALPATGAKAPSEAAP